jgi:hypothetical protein
MKKKVNAVVKQNQKVKINNQNTNQSTGVIII